MSVLISMLVGSRQSEKKLVENSILSIISNIGTSDFLLVIGVSSYIKPGIVKCVNDIKLKHDNIVAITEDRSTFAQFHNHVFLKYGTGSKWFIVAHDDIELKTENLVNNVENSLKSSTEDVGWISFTDDDYLHGHWAPSTRPGFHSDYLYADACFRRKLFQFHSLEENYWKKGSGISYHSKINYDFPTSVVKCHAPFSHFIMIETKKLRKIGLCEDWSKISLLIDADWGLSALKNGLFNIWIPDIIYTHVRQVDGTRAWGSIWPAKKQVHELFAKKWGFFILSIVDNVKEIKRMYGKTKIVWSFDRNSFDWDYLK